MRRLTSIVFTLGLFGCQMLGPALPRAFAQANRASITGTVTDSSGAVIAGVSITATNVDTNVVSSTVSDHDGVYVVPNLPPGKYSVEFKKDGFETLRLPAITLISTQVARLDGQLPVGSVSTSITVTSNAPVLDEERPTIGTNMQGSVITDLPLSIYNGGRFVENFAVAITPGYSPISDPYGAVVNGGQWFTKDYTVDGTSGTADIQGDDIETQPGMEAVQEVQSQTSGLDVQSSITGGGVMSFNLKSGTNKLHGSSFLYGHNEFLDANTWTNDNQGLPKGRARAWDYGGSLGGPIIKDKTFFFGTFERYTQTDFRLGGFSSVVPSTDFLNGNFSALLNTSQVLGTDTHGNPIYSGAIFNPKDPGAVFVGNMIPMSMFSSAAQKIVAIYQKDYMPEGPGLNVNNRLPLNNSPGQTPNEAVVKLDHNLSERDHLSGSWIYDHRPRTLVDSGGVWQAGTTDGGPLGDGRLQLVRSHQFRVSESHTLSSSGLNVFNAAYNWYWNGSQPINSATNWPQTLGFGNTGAPNFPLISFGNAVNGYNETFIGSTWQGSFVGDTLLLGDTLTWTKGRHNFSFGGTFDAHQINSHAGSGALSFNFDNNSTGAPSQSYANQVGFGFASFLLGDVATASETTPFDLYGRQKSMAFFGEDSYKVTPRLTLEFGLRWNYNFRFHEKYGHWANFDLNAIDPKLGVPGTLVFAQNGGDSFEKNETYDAFGPQIGFAWSPWKKVVFRGSFGIIYNPVGVAYFSGVPDGFAPGFQGTNLVNTPFNWDAGYPGVFQPGNMNIDPTTLFPLVYTDPNALRIGFSDAFNVGAQYELTPNMRVELSYVGNRGHRLTDTALDYNEGPTATFLRLAKQYPDLNGFNHYVCSPSDAASYDITYPYAGFCGPVLAAIAPSPQAAAAESNYWYYPNLLYVGLPAGQSYYDSMVIDVAKRTGRGLTMDLSYTLSRQEGNTFSAEQEGNGYYTPIQDFSNVAESAHTVTNYDLHNVVKGFVSYELPFGNGRPWLANQGRAVNRIVGGWTLAGIVTYYTGQPFQVGVQNPYFPQWGNLYPDFNLSGFAGPSNPRKFQVPQPNQPVPSVDFYMPATVAGAPAPGELGTGPATDSDLRCPGAASENVSLLKYFPFGTDGRYKLSFRAEFYNVFNRHQYNINGCGGNRSLIGADNFGQIFGVQDNPRTGQFAVRFDF
jgi:Carboxypeptidase regulatory-like domain